MSRASPLSLQALEGLFTLIDQHIAQGRYPGCQIALAWQGEVLVERSFGMARIGVGHAADTQPMPANNDHLWLLYSNTKVLMATALWQLMDQGLLRFTDRVTDHLPEFGTHGKEGITLWHLITHQAGFPNAEVPASL